MRNKIFLIFCFIILFNLLFIAQAQAVCPVCTIAVGACLGLSRWLGIDDLVTGLWVGGLVVSLSAWTINWLNKKNFHWLFRKLTILAAYYIMIFLPLFYTGIIGHIYNKFFGIDKLLFSSAIGSIAFYLGTKLHDWLKKKNHDRSYFPFQKVVLPITPLIIFSIIFYFLTCN